MHLLEARRERRKAEAQAAGVAVVGDDVLLPEPRRDLAHRGMLQRHVAPALVGVDVLVAPASVLRAIAERTGPTEGVAPLQVVSVAETLDPEDEAVVRATFGQPVEQIYQATEGLLATSCRAGRLHLNEGHVHVEPEWLDHRRFHPIVTDFTRTTVLFG